MKSPRLTIISMASALFFLAGSVAIRPGVDANVAAPGATRLDVASAGLRRHSRRTTEGKAGIQTQAVPNIIGVYTGTISGSTSNCTPTGGGGSFGPLGLAVEVYAQNGSSFNAFAFATGQATTGTSSNTVPMNGTISSDGTVTGSYDYEASSSNISVSNSGTFAGSISGGKMSLQLAGMTSETGDGQTFGCEVMYAISAGITTPQTQSDLSITVQATPGPLASGTRITYSYTVSNKGPNDAQQAVMSDVIPTGATLASVSTSQGSVSAPNPGGTGEITVLFGTIPTGGSVAVTITLNIISASGTTLSNTGSAGSLSSDPSPGNNSVTTNTQIMGGALVTLEWTQPTPTAVNPTPAPTNLRAVPVIANQPANLARAAGEFPESGSCTLVDINIYKSDQPDVQTIPANLWATVPPDQAQATLAAAPGGSFYVLTNLWNCGGTLIESGGSNEAGVPPGPTVTKVKVGLKLKINGSSFTSSITVFIDGIGFARQAAINDFGVVVQKGTLTNGMAIPDYVTSGKTVLITVQNSDGGLGTYSYTKP